MRVTTSSEAVEVMINVGCPSEDHVLVVVQEVGSNPRPLGSYSVPELVELTLAYSQSLERRQAAESQPTAVYIAANFTRGREGGRERGGERERELHGRPYGLLSFPDSRDLFQLGDGMVYGSYTNHKLQQGTKYRVGVVGVSGDAQQPAVVMTSNEFSESYHTHTHIMLFLPLSQLWTDQSPQLWTYQSPWGPAPSRDQSSLWH